MAINRLARDTRKLADRIDADLARLAKIGESIDDRDLRMVEGKLADASLFLRGAANRFERRSEDYPKPAPAGPIVCSNCGGRIDQDELGRFQWVPKGPRDEPSIQDCEPVGPNELCCDGTRDDGGRLYQAQMAHAAGYRD